MPGSDSDGSCCPLPALGSSVTWAAVRGKAGADILLLRESSLQAVLPDLWGMCSNDQPLLTWERGSSALGSKSNKCGFMQAEVPPEKPFRGTLPQASSSQTGPQTLWPLQSQLTTPMCGSRKVWDAGDWDSSSTEVMPGKGEWDEDPWQQQAG